MAGTGTRRPGLRVAMVVVVIVTLLGLCHVWLHLRVIHLAYALAQDTRALEQAEETSRRLRAEIAYLKSPERIEKIAHERLGLAPTEPTALRIVRAPQPRQRVP